MTVGQNQPLYAGEYSEKPCLMLSLPHRGANPAVDVLPGQPAAPIQPADVGLPVDFGGVTPDADARRERYRADARAAAEPEPAVVDSTP